MLRGYKTEMVISQIGQWSVRVLGVDIRDTVCHSNDQSNEEVKCSTVRTSFCVQFLPMRDPNFGDLPNAVRSQLELTFESIFLSLIG